MKSRQKKFCPRCNNRIRRTSSRCHYCRAFVPSWPRVAGLAFLLLAALLVVGRLIA